MINVFKNESLNNYLKELESDQTFHIYVLVSVPPEKLLILDDKGTIIPHHILGPYNEGSSVNITCIATGGKNPGCEIRLLSHESSVCPSCLTILLFRQLHMTYDMDRL
jgi:hypothetical protein